MARDAEIRSRFENARKRASDLLVRLLPAANDGPMIIVHLVGFTVGQSFRQ